MEIHAPEAPIKSIKDFLVHIAIVTCGILIALGLEGIRESVHNHHAVRETRENVRFQMQINLDHSQDELKRVTLYSRQLQTLAEDLPTLAAQRPEEIHLRLAQIENPGYFFLSDYWQTALSTGVLEHMSTSEVSAYGGAAEIIKIYSGLQQVAEGEETRTKAFFTAHPRLTPEQVEQGTEHLLLFYDAERALANVGPQMKEQVEQALSTASNR